MKRRELLKKSSMALGLSALYRGRELFTPQERARAQVAKKGFFRPKPALWMSPLEENKVQCSLCPLECLLQEGERALCRVRENQNGRGYTLSYGNPVLIQEDPVERKPFFHILPGSRALSISTAGCNLHCTFCEVWDMALVDPEEVHAYDVPPEMVIELARRAGLSSISYAFGEPVIYYEYMKDVASLAREEGLLNLIHTNAYINREPLEELLPLLDGVNVDLKSFDENIYQEAVGGELTVVLENSKRIKEANIHLELTHITIPTLSDNLETIEKMCQWIVEELGGDVPLHFARFYPLYKLASLPQTPVSTLDRAREIALKKGLNYVYISRVTGHEGEKTFCPECQEIIIHRLGFIVDDIKIEDGRCLFCGHRIPGLWSME